MVPNQKVTVLDAQAIAWGAAGRNSGFMIDLPHDVSADSYSGGLEKDLKEIRMYRRAIDFAADAVEDYGLQAHFNPCGKYHGAVDKAGLDHLDEYSRQLDRLGEPYSRLDRKQLAEVTGTDFYAGGIHAPGTVMTQPAGYIRGLADGLANNSNVSIYEHSPVVRIDKGTIHRVVTPEGEVSAAKVLLCVNGHAQSFGYYTRRLMHIYTFASMTRKLTENEMTLLGGSKEWGLIPANPQGSTVRRYRDRLLIRNTFTYNPSMETSKEQIEHLGRRHDKSFINRFGKKLSNVSMEYRWGGQLCLSLNSVQGFGLLEPGIYSAVCQKGLGVGVGTYAGMAIVDLALGLDNDTVRDLGSEQPQKLYPEPLMTIGAKSVLWWKHFRAGLEL